MKFLFATDTHLKGKNPANRLDDFPAAMLTKLKELCAIAIFENATAILHGGDLFDQPDCSNRLIGEVGQIIRGCGIPFYVVPGNHDVFGYNIASLPQTALGVLAKTGVVKILDRASGGAIFEELDAQGRNVSVGVQGQEYYADIDKGTNDDYRFEPMSLVDHKILIPHSMLLDKPFYPGIPTTLTKDVKTDADLILVGHYHPGFPDHRVGTTRYINPGSMGRLDATKATIDRTPQYLVITAKAQEELLVEFRDFKTAKPGHEVLDPTNLQLRARHTQQFEQFKQNVQQASVTQATNVKDVLLSLAQAKSLPQEVIDLSQDRIMDAELQDKATSDTTGFVEKFRNVQIAKVIMENFQSHDYTVVEFKDGLNAIVGASDSGKSAIMRAIRWALFNEPKSADFIRHGAKDVKVTVVFDNGEYVIRSRSTKSAGEYIIGQLDPSIGQTKEVFYTGFGSSIPVETLNVSQMPKSNLGRGDAQSLNMRAQLEGPFLLGESPATGAAIIGRLTGVHLVDTAVKGINQDYTHGNNDLKHLRQSLAGAETQMDEFAYLPAWEHVLKMADMKVVVADLNEQRVAELDRLKDDIEHTQLDIDVFEKAYGALPDTDKLSKLLLELEDLSTQQARLSVLAESIIQAKNEIHSYSRLLDSYGCLGQASELANDAAEKLNVCNRLSEVKGALDGCKQDIRNLSRKLESVPDTEHASSLLAKAEEVNQRAEDMFNVQNRYLKHSESVQKLNKEYRAHCKDLVSCKHELEEKMGDLDICPVCDRPMDSHTHSGTLEEEFV